MTAKWNSLKRDLFSSHPLCKFCKIRPAVHLHHAVVNKGKVRNKCLHKCLDVKENALEVCEKCHKFADSYAKRREAYYLNAQRYGAKRMRAWYDGLPLKIKEHVIGVLAIYKLLVQKSAFSTIDYELFNLLAGHAATAIFSSRLYTQSERKLTTIQSFLELLKEKPKT